MFAVTVLRCNALQINLVTESDALLSVNVSQVAELQQEYSQLLTSIIENSPKITLFDDDRWMNVSLYEGPWKKFVEELQNVYEKYVGSK